VLNFTSTSEKLTIAGIPLYLRLFTTSKVLMIYLRLLLVPIGLHMEWLIEPARSFMQDIVFLSIAGSLIIGIFSYVLYKTSKPKFFAIGWFFITLIPYSNIFPLAYFMGESWLYIPSIGFFTFTTIYLSELGKRSRLWNLIVIFIVCFLVISYSFLTIRRSEVWADPVKLYKEILKYSPNSTRARIQLGTIIAKGETYLNNKMHDAALEEFKKAIETDPKNYIAHNNIGIIYKKKGDIKKAMEEYEKALELNPDYPLTYNNIGNIHLESGQYDDAIRFYKKAISIDSYNAGFYGNVGKAYKYKRMPKEAQESFEKALSLDPDNKDALEGLNAVK